MNVCCIRPPQERVTARAAHRQLALERQLLVRRLYDYATGASHDQAGALEASAAIRKNIMEEVCFEGLTP